MSSLLGMNGAEDEEVGLARGLVAHYLLNNNADDSHGAFDGVDVGTVEYQGDRLDPLSGSVTIPNSSASSCSYWKDSGSGMVFTYTTTIITSLATDNYSNLRMYSDTKDASFQAELFEEGYYPKPLPLPTTVGLIAHYPLTGTAEDTTGNYDGTEVSATYKDDTEFGSVYDGGGNIIVNTSATALATWCCYWVDSGAGWVFTKTATIPSTLTTNDYRNLRLYSLTPSLSLQDEIEAYELNFRPIDIDDGLVAYYPLAKNSLDNYGIPNEYDGVDTAMRYDGLSGAFNGTTSKITTPYSITDFSEQSFSLFAKFDNLTASHSLIDNGWASPSTFVFEQNSNAGITFGMRSGSAYEYYSLSSLLTVDTWFHLVYVKHPTRVELFIDGVYVNEVAVTSTTTVTTALQIGMRQSGALPFEGDLARVRFYNKAITPEQIEAIYNTEKGDFI